MDFLPGMSCLIIHFIIVHGTLQIHTICILYLVIIDALTKETLSKMKAHGLSDTQPIE